MNKKVFIIHQDEIVRKGLGSIVNNYFNIEIIQLSDIEGIRAYQHISDSKIILFYEQNHTSKEDLINSLHKKNDMLIVGFEDAQSHTFRHDHLITVKTESSEIIGIIQKGLSIKNNPVYHTEGKELTRREKEVLKLVASGFSNKKIAESLFISTHTVISHRKKITQKTGIKSISGLTVYAILNKLIDTENMNPEDLI